MESLANRPRRVRKCCGPRYNTHCNHRRKDAEAAPYINHSIALANVLANEGCVDDVTVLCPAVAHETIIDNETTADEL